MIRPILGANMAWQLGGDARQLRMLASMADGLVLVECRTKDNKVIDVAKILGSGWRVWQDTSSPAKGGTVIALRRKSRLSVRRGVRLGRRLRKIANGGPKLQDRYVRSLPVRDEAGPFELMGCHIPLPGTGEQEGAFMEVRNTWRDVPGRKALYMDGNARPNVSAQKITAPNFSGEGVVVWCWSKGWHQVEVTWKQISNLDHKVGAFSTHKEK